MHGMPTRKSWLAVLVAGAAIGVFGSSTLAQATTAPSQPEKNTPKSVQPAKPEVKTSTGIKIGDEAPDFTVKDTDGKEHKLSDYTSQGKIVVLEWFNPDCPVSAGFHTSSHVMAETAAKFKDKGVVWIAVNSGGAGKEGAGVDRNVKAKKDWKIEYPILLDEAGTVGRSFGAKTTPHMFIVGADRKLAYKGDILDQSDSKINYVDQALTQVIAKETVTKPETKPNGCGVKYAPEPKKAN